MYGQFCWYLEKLGMWNKERSPLLGWFNMKVSVRGRLDQEMLEKLLHLPFLCEILLCGRPKQQASEDRACKPQKRISLVTFSTTAGNLGHQNLVLSFFLHQAHMSEGVNNVLMTNNKSEITECKVKVCVLLSTETGLLSQNLQTKIHTKQEVKAHRQPT